jgi:putative membrane protein
MHTHLLLAHGHWFPWFPLIPLVFWATVITAVVIFRRGRHIRSGIAVLGELFARGEISEAEYRSRLAVLKESRR